MYLEAQLYATGNVSSDAWEAMYQKAQDKNFGTSKADINEYATIGGSTAAASACISMGAAVAAPLCAEVGGYIGGTVANLIQGFGASLFGGGDDHPTIAEYWNPIADKAIAGIVNAVRAKKGLPTNSPPGGSARNYPEWQPVAEVWARNVNSFTGILGGKIIFFDVSGSNAGRIRSEAEEQTAYCFFFGDLSACLPQSQFDKKKNAICSANNPAIQVVCKALSPQQKAPDPAVKAKYEQLCAGITGCDAAKAQTPLNQAIVQGTQQTAEQLLGSPSDTSSGLSTPVKVAGVAVAGAALWYFRQPLIDLMKGLFKG